MIDKKYVLTWKGTKNLIIVPKLYCNAEYWRLEKLMWMVNGYEAKAKVQTTAKYIQFDAWARTGTKRYNAKTGEC